MADINTTTGAYGSGSYGNNLTAFFDSRSEAERAVERLKEAGVPASSIRFVPGTESGSNTTTVADEHRSGFWAKLEDFFFPDDDRATYAEGLSRGGFLVAVSGLDQTLYQTAHDILDDDGSINIDERADQWRSEGWNYSGSNATSASASYDATARSAGREDAFDAGERDTIPVVEENLRVGKRDVNSGSVRVRSYTVDRPVREDVSLRDESVTIERHAVDRPLTDADNAFRDRTIAAEEHHEEAVVAKDARVVEEIGIKKTATERTETIQDTVRKTEVEVEDNRNGDLSQSQTGLGQSHNTRRD
jgi:uncharacterized protein (TIGR02271 family)